MDKDMSEKQDDKSAVEKIFGLGWSIGYCATSSRDVYEMENASLNIGEEAGIPDKAIRLILEAGITTGEDDAANNEQ